MQRVMVPALCASAILTAGFGLSSATADPLSLQSNSYGPARQVPAYMAQQYSTAPDYDEPRPPAPVRYLPPQQPERYAAAARPQTNYGGGLIEFLFGGAQRLQPAQPVATPASYGAPAQEAATEHTRAPVDPKFDRQIVAYHGHEKAGTIVIDTPNRFLYLVQGDGTAIRYGIGVGRPGFTWAGVKSITAKKEWPDWVPPPEMLQRRPDLPAWMAGGPENPLGARAMYLGSSLYRIHGSNEPWTIGQAVSSGCIRLRNEDVIDLYNRVKVGTKVVVI